VTNSKSWSADEKDDQAWDCLFLHCTEDVSDYLNSEGPNGDMLDIGSSSHIEVATHGDETEHSKILRVPEARNGECLLLRFLLRLKLPQPSTSPPLGMFLLKLSKVR